MTKHVDTRGEGRAGGGGKVWFGASDWLQRGRLFVAMRQWARGFLNKEEVGGGA